MIILHSCLHLLAIITEEVLPSTAASLRECSGDPASSNDCYRRQCPARISRDSGTQAGWIDLEEETGVGDQCDRIALEARGRVLEEV